MDTPQQPEESEKTTTLQLFKRKQAAAKENFDPKTASKKEIREYHKRNYEMRK